MHTQQSKRILMDMYDGFRQRYMARNPGCNENDIERAFLSAVCVMVYGDLDARTRERIARIA